MSSSIDRRAVDLLLSIVESTDAKVAGAVLSDYHANSAGKLLAANVLIQTMLQLIHTVMAVPIIPNTQAGVVDMTMQTLIQ